MKLINGVEMTDEQILENAVKALESLKTSEDKIKILTEENETFKANEATLTEAKEKAETDLKEANEAKEKAEKDFNDLTESTKTTTEENETLKAEKTRVEEEAVGVRTELHNAVAKQIALVKLLMGKTNYADFETDNSELQKRTNESLDDSLEDLLKEFVKHSTNPEKIDDPTGGFQNNSGKTKETNTSFADRRLFEQHVGDIAAEIVAKTR